MTKDYNTICDRCGLHAWYDSERPCTNTRIKCPGTLRLIDTSDLDPRFTRFYQSGERIEVTYDWGETERFYVGKSTGWKPIYLAIKRRDSSGGAAILSSSVTNIRPLGKFRGNA